MLSACGGAATPSSGGAEGDAVTVFGAYATQIEEPWDGVIHSALQAEADAGRITYTFTDDIGYAGDMERVLRETADQDQPDIIFGDAFGNEEAARAVAADYPEIAFVFGSGGGPAEPNFSVFDNWIHEPAYLAGMLAGGVTESNVIGVVGGYPVPEVNRIVNAFIAGAQETNSEVDVKVTFLNSWFDPAAAKEAALAQIGAGADVLYAERFGVIEAAQENDLVAIGNMSDQKELAPGQRGDQRHLEHGAHGRVRDRPGDCRVLHVSGSQGLLDGRQRRRSAGGGEHGRAGRGSGRPGGTGGREGSRDQGGHVPRRHQRGNASGLDHPGRLAGGWRDRHLTGPGASRDHQAIR